MSIMSHFHFIRVRNATILFLVLLFVNTVTYRDCRGTWIVRREKRPIALAIGVPSNEASEEASAIECHRIYE